MRLLGGRCLPLSRLLQPRSHGRLHHSDSQVSSLLRINLLSPLQESLLPAPSSLGNVYPGSCPVTERNSWYELNWTAPKLSRSQIGASVPGFLGYCSISITSRFNFGTNHANLHCGSWIRGFCSETLEYDDERENEDDGFQIQSNADPVEVDRICKVIDELFALDRNMEAVLDECGIILTSDLVVDVLKRFKHARKPAFRFFCWADRKPDFSHDSQTFNTMMAILGKTRQFETMVSMLEDMGKRGLLTMETFAIAIKAFASAKERKKSVAVFELMKKHKFKAGIGTVNFLLDSLGRVKLAKEAQLLFEKLSDRFTPNLQTYTVLLSGWCKAKNLLEAAKIWNEMVDQGFKPDIVTHNIMIEGLLKVKKKSDAIKLFEVMKAKGPAPNVRSYTILIRDFCKQGKMTEAVALFDEMARSGCEPDAAVYTCLITGFGNRKNMDEAYTMLREMKEKGFPPDGKTYNAIIKLLTNRRMPGDAVRVYNDMIRCGIEPTIHTYNMIMKSFFVAGNYEMGCSFWDEMVRRGCCPDENSYTVLIGGLIRQGSSEAACRYVEEMINKGMRVPQIDYYKFVADFSRFGRPNILEELAEKMRDLGKVEVSEVFARWAEMTRRKSKRRDHLQVLW